MYQCTITIYFAACPPQVEETIKAISPLEHFSHAYEESAEASADKAGRADLILAGPACCNDNDLRVLLQAKKPEAELIVLREKDASPPPEFLPALTDIWPWPLNSRELGFHFRRWQNIFKQGKDLSQSGQFLECLMNTSPNLIWFKDKTGVHELVNASFCQTVNKTRQQVQGRGHAYIWDVESDDPACIESERIVMESGKIHTNEEHITTGEGDRILITYKAPLRDFDQSMMGTMGIGIDVTRERQYYARLLQNNAALETIFTTMDAGILTHALDGSRALSVNNAALKLLDYASLEDLNENFQMVAANVLPEDKERLYTAIKQLKNAGDTASYEYRIAHKDGSLLHIMGNAKLVEKDGELICQRFLLDVTAQRLAEEKAKSEQERRQKELVRALSVDFQLVFVVDEEGENGAILQLLDYPDQQLKNIFDNALPLIQKIKAYIATCVHPDDRKACEAEFSIGSLHSKLAVDGIYYFNYRVIHEGETHFFQMKAVRAGTIGDSYGIIIGLQSVDSRIRYEMEQRSILSEALKQARRASQAKSAFLSNMSHDIRTPMNAVLGYTALALNHPENSDAVKSYLGKIRDSGSHLVNLINDILDMSHIESGKIQLEENLCHLPLLLREIQNIVKPMADAKNQALSFEMADLRNTDVYCDKLRLKQVLLNLLGNSVKYTPAHGVINLAVSQRACPLAGHATYEFRISDNGIGMSSEFLERIFEPFEREHTAATASIQGTGLGMAITKSIVDLMKGEIAVRSELGSGTEFTILLTFRAHAVKDVEKRKGASFDSNESGSSAPSRRGNILLVEDNDMNQEIAYEFLTGAGYAVDVANNGQEAVEKMQSAQAGDYDIILMDVQMPVLDGYKATGMIRGLPDRSVAAIPIVAMTANSFEEDRMEALNRGMNGHIAKPIDFKELFALLDKFLLDIAE